MEKLQPILKQKYWICFGLSLIFVLFGWWNASGDLAAKTAERKTSVDGSFTKAGQGATDPNETWVAGAKKENDADKVDYKTASLQLWRRQQSAREWPEQIRSEMKNIPYFDEVNSKETRERWASIYEKQIDGLLEIVNPFQFDTGEGLVLVDSSRITRQVPNKWQIDLPTTNEIWSNQEDIWLLKALLTSISRTNDSSTRITESQVREIKQLRLRGGDPKTKPGSKVGGLGGGMGGSFGGAGGEGDAGGMPMSGGMGGLGIGGGSGAASHTHPGTAFEGNSSGDILAEEFGADAASGGLGGSGLGMLSMSTGMGNPSSNATAAKKETRYVHDAAKDQGYKTRAFLLDVVIRDERLPDLLAKLTNSDFPVEIVRVEIISRSGGGAAGMSGGGMGEGGLSGGMTGGGYSESGGMSLPGGMGMSGGGPGGFGGSGMMSQGMGGSSGFSGVSSVGGMSGRGLGGDSGFQGGGTTGSGMLDGGSGTNSGTEVLNAAMADPLLIEVRIGGLLTLYMTPEETETQAKTEETAAKEAAAAATPATAAPAALGTQASPDDTTPGSVPALDTSPTGPTDGVIPGEADSSPPSDPALPGESPPPADPLNGGGTNGTPLPEGSPIEPDVEAVPLGETTP